MTVGNSARIQVNMAQVQTKYGSQLDSLENSSKFSKYNYSASSETLNSLLNSNALKNKSSEYRDQFSSLYKSIYGISDEDGESTSSTSQSIKAASANAGGSAEGMKSFANGLKYGGEVDLEAYKTQAQSFVDNYNALVDKVGNSDNNNVLQKGVLMVNSTKVYTSSLNRAGITVGSDNKLSLKSDLSGVSASDIKSAFGTYGYSDKIIQKSRQINTLTGGSGLFTVKNTTSGNSTSSSEKTDNSGTLKELTAAVKDAATAVKSYANNLGSEGSSFSATDFTDTAKTFVEKYNSFIEETAKSDKSGVNSKGIALNSITNSYKYALERAGINIGKDGKLSLSDDLSKVTDKDVKYAFGYGSYIDKVNQKADQINSLAGSASAMSYSSNSNLNYIYSTGALMNVYA